MSAVEEESAAPTKRLSCTKYFDALWFCYFGWWSNYGVETPNLRMMAMRILSLTSSSSGCERNWSTFEGIHTKKRSRLNAERLNNLVYVQLNVKLLNKKKKLKEKSDVLLASEASMAQGWIVDGGDEDDDEEVHPGSGISWETISSATGADGFLQNLVGVLEHK